MGDEKVFGSKERDALWKWHSIAFKLGRSEKYLSRITEVATALAKGQPLSKKALSAMEKDFNHKKHALISCSECT